MSAESWHGWCHNYGMGGHCNNQCPVFLGEHDESCPCESEIVEEINDSDLIEMYEETEEAKYLNEIIYRFLSGQTKEFVKILTNKYIPKLQKEVIKQQTVCDVTIESELIKILEIKKPYR